LDPRGANIRIPLLLKWLFSDWLYNRNRKITKQLAPLY
jgi:hypothetical protein